MRRKESKKRIERVERMKGKENKRKKEFLLARDHPFIRDGKPLYRLSK